MPIVYSVEFDSATTFHTSLAKASNAARDITMPDEPVTDTSEDDAAPPATDKTATIRQHTAAKADMSAIMDALHGVGWADKRNADLCGTFRNGKKIGTR